MSRTRVDLIDDRLRLIDEERGAIEAELSELPAVIREARMTALRAAPLQATDGIATPVRRLSERQSKAERRLQALTDEREAAVQVAAEEDAKHKEQLTRELVTRGTHLREQELRLWGEAGAALASLVELFEVRIVGAARELEALRHEARRAGLVADAVPELQAPIRPFPGDAHGFLELIYAAGADPGGHGGREVGEPSATRSDDEWRLGAGLVPDLRGGGRVRLRGVEQAVAVSGS